MTSLNLIADPWIPVIRDSEQIIVRPYEIAQEGISRLDWPRGDLNLACVEFLVGLWCLSDPPCNNQDWRDRYTNPDLDRMRAKMLPFARHFELAGDGPRFLQDLEHFEDDNGNKPKSPDMLFIDSAGSSTALKNADLMIKRDRYTALRLPLAAVALYTLQSFAPSGGKGNRTSMRGGGPMVTLAQPLDGGKHTLWRMVWSNVPESEALSPKTAEKALPWLRPTRTSENNRIVTPQNSHHIEAFFGMPRRIRLLFEEGTVTGVLQKPYGTNYKGWQHPLSPYYRQETGGELLPVHPKPGKVSYRNWLGQSFGKTETREIATAIRRLHNLANPPDFEVCMGGWAMDKMKPLDFNMHPYPTFCLNESDESRVANLVNAANKTVGKLTGLLKNTVAIEGHALNAVREEFFANTEISFVSSVKSIPHAKEHETEENWIATLRRTALMLFDEHVIPVLSDKALSKIENSVVARRSLLGFFSKPTGIRKVLDLPSESKGTAT